MARLRTARLVSTGDCWLFEVADQGGEHHYVYSVPDYVFCDDGNGDHWITVAVCAVDDGRGVVLVEFQDGAGKGINRMWVPKNSVDQGETHAFGFPAETGFPVVRVDLGTGMTAWDEKIRVVLIERTAEAAQMEADRLNRLNGGKHLIYFWQAAKSVNPVRD